MERARKAVGHFVMNAGLNLHDRSAPGTAKVEGNSSTSPAESSTSVASAKVVPQKIAPKKQASSKAVRAKTEPVPEYEALGLRYDPSQLPIVQTLDPTQVDYSEEVYAASVVHGRSVHQPFFHPRTHDIPVANIHFRSHHVKLLNLFTHFATHAASSLGIPTSKVVPLPTQRTLWTVLRSPFAHKKSQENFDRKVHKRAVKAWDADPEVVQRWIAYLRAHAMAGVGMRVTTWERLPLGVGSRNIKTGDDNAENKNLNAPKEILKLGKQIIKNEASGAPSRK
ncbi:37S ribosomal protein S10, mitochondrial [Psilocybe cubensis]|uniref:Small ribosomal subunit protein uS10m n=2 Tax=Psilocybe cubensis TaxID=181762 RepID=A0A8H8CF88_PSICU|nr:37S ribosomal protein S10, mitochondrial [Psilocybe cubensis]KAH9475366.1 37S ribosomal protein S10, mitochondrial [Psilocybe cubensis]